MDSNRFNKFTDAYAPALLRAIGPGPHPLAPGETPEDYALSTAVTMMERLQLYGLDSIAHYLLNRQAFAETCRALGIENSSRSIEAYLEGR